ncbi:hypothetical protein BCV70DRAFT_152838, partial [Testicularia cyperi]
DPSPTGSIRSIASSQSGTLSRPPPPPKPSHLSSAFTGTCNSIALRNYIHAQKTGGSFTSDSPSGTISKAHFGYGYPNPADGYVDAFDSSSNSSSSDDEHESSDARGRRQDVTVGTARPATRSRTYTAPSVSRIFSPAADQDAGDGTTRLIRNEPIAIDGSGPSRVGNLRNLFEASAPVKPATSSVQPLSRQVTGNNGGVKVKPRVSNQVRMLQAQITGEQLSGEWNVDRFQRRTPAQASQLTGNSIASNTSANDDDDGDDIYRTATEEMLGDALKMDAVVIPPSTLNEAADAAAVGPTADRGTVSASSSKGALCSPKLDESPPTEHERDDSTATIRPSAQVNGTIAVTNTARKVSPHTIGSSHKQSRLSSIFTASPHSSHAGSPASASPSRERSPAQSISTSPSPDHDAEDRNERSREPSMLVPDESFETSRHLRANDGSCFDLDWGSQVSPSKASLRQRAQAQYRRLSVKSEMGGEDDEATIDANAGRRRASAQRSGSGPMQAAGMDPSASVAEAVSTSDDRASIAEQSRQLAVQATPEAERPLSGRLPQPGIGRSARALYDFEGEAAFNELSIRAGESFDILNEQLAGGWSLGVVWDADGVPRRGLIPQGWYCYIQDFTMSPPPSQGIEPPPTPALLDEEEEEGAAAGQAVNAQTIEIPSIRLSSTRSGENEAFKVPSAPATQHSVSMSRSVSASSQPSHASRLSSNSTVAAVAPGSPIRLTTEPHPSTDTAATSRQERIAVSDRISNRPTESKIISMPRADIMQKFQNLSASRSLDRTEIIAEEISEQAPAEEIPAFEAGGTVAEDAEPDAPVQDTAQIEDVAADAVQEQESPSKPQAASPEPSNWKGSIFGQRTFNRFASFVTSGAEDYVLSNHDLGEDERSRKFARKVSGSKSSHPPPAISEIDEDSHGRAELMDSADTSMSGAVGGAAAEPDQHFVIAGPAGPKWRSKTPTFLVQVHHPEKRTKMNGMQEYTMYHVTCTFPVNAENDTRSSVFAGEGDQSVVDLGSGETLIPYDPLGGPYPPGAQLTVLRRFTQFEWLHQVLSKHYSALLIPPLPEKQYSGRFASDFIETRRADLEMWISRIVRHPVLRYSEPVQFFLSCEDEVEWRSRAARLLRGDSKRAKGGVFASTWHPDFNFDATDAAIEAESIDAYLRAMEKTINGVGGHNAGKQGIMSAYRGHREGNVHTSSTYRDLSYTMLRMLTGAGAAEDPAASASVGMQDPWAHEVHGPPMGNVGRRDESGATNEHGAWCWREGCHDCVNLTSALQNTAESLQDVADLYEQHAQETLLRQHERIKELSRPHAAVQSLLDTHRTTLSKYCEATGEPDPLLHRDGSGGSNSGSRANANGGVDRPRLPPKEAEKVASRCETVLNVTLSEMDRLHDERVEDWHALGRSFLDSEIDLYESILETLRAARAHYEPQYYDRGEGTHILASRYQPDLTRPRRPPRSLAMPSAAQTPSGGLGAGMGMLLSQATGG